jgi:hypothetical protein
MMKLKFVRKSSNEAIMFLVAVLGVMVISVSQVEALPITILNPSFEDPGLSDGLHVYNIANWDIDTANRAGVFNPTSASFTSVPDGFQTAWLNEGRIGQWLAGSSLTADTVYTLKVDIGRRKESGVDFPGYLVELVLNDPGRTVIALDDNTLTPSLGEFETSTVSFTALSGDPNLGKQLGIRFTTYGVQTNFDDVRLDAATTPEPGTIFLMGLGVLVLGIVVRQRRNKH